MSNAFSYFIDSQNNNYQSKQELQSKKIKSIIKTIINGFIVSGQFNQEEQKTSFNINSSTNKQQKYFIQFKNDSLDQNIKQHFKNSHELFVYLSQSTKNRLKITNGKQFSIEIEKDKIKYSFPYSLIEQKINQVEFPKEQKEIEKINNNQIKQEVKNNTNQQQESNIQIQKAQMQEKIFSQLEKDIKNTQTKKQQENKKQQQTAQLQKFMKSHEAHETQKQIPMQKQQDKKIIIKTDLEFVKLPNQQQTLLEFAINSKIEPLTKFIAQNSLINIEELILKRFNMTEIPPFNQLSFKALKNLVLEDNRISKIQNLQTCCNLQKLNLDSNKIQKIQNLHGFTNLKFLKLGNNQISYIEGLDKLSSLQTLWLDFNNIAKIENLQNLKSLKSLNLSFNQIEKIQNLQSLKQLWELMISDNQLTYISNLDYNVKLGRLALNSNIIEHITGLRKLLFLENLHLIGNQISKFDKRQFQQVNWLKMLKELKLNGNGIIIDQQNKGLIQRLRNYGVKVYV